MTTTTTSPNPLPPELLAKAAEAIVVDRQKFGYHTTHQEARVDAEVALLAADVPGLLAERDKLREMVNAWHVRCTAAQQAAEYAEKAIATAERERSEARAALSELVIVCEGAWPDTHQGMRTLIDARRVLGKEGV